jgi:site-specific recombinase XerD
MLKAGVHPKIVQERLGYSRVGVTLDIYSHVTPGLQEAAAQRFEDGLTVAREKESEPILG